MKVLSLALVWLIPQVGTAPNAYCCVPTHYVGQEKLWVQALPTYTVFDLPALRSLSITQIRTHLGKPNWSDSEPEEMFTGSTQWYKIYRRNGIELRIDYQTLKGGKIIRFYLNAIKGPVPEQELNNLLATGNIEVPTKGLQVKPIFLHQDPKPTATLV